MLKQLCVSHIALKYAIIIQSFALMTFVMLSALKAFSIFLLALCCASQFVLVYPLTAVILSHEMSVSLLGYLHARLLGLQMKCSVFILHTPPSFIAAKICPWRWRPTCQLTVRRKHIKH